MQYNSGPFISDSDNDAQVKWLLSCLQNSNKYSLVFQLSFDNLIYDICKQTNSGLNLVYPHVNFTNKDVMGRNLN